MSTRRARRANRAAPKPKLHPRAAVPATFARASFGGHALWISLALAVGTTLAYAGVWRNAFVAWDDPHYVSENAEVLAGLTWHGIVWAFTTTQGANWHPVTWLSHMLDAQLFGADAGMHHAAGLVLHIANSILLFGVLHRMTGALGRSAFVAALFALHPLHVESVAWAAERKDVLSAFFWMLSMAAYVAYVERPQWWRYALLLVAFALGLMSKAMLVTLPFVLLLLDVWPLARHKRAKWFALVREKAPLFLLTFAFALVTFAAQRGAGALQQLGSVSIGLRLENAMVTYVAYLVDAVWPVRLAAFYQFPASIPGWKVAAAAAALLSGSIAAIAAMARRPYVAVGWFWYLGTLVPVIGIIQVGYQASADRYTYIPLIGIFIVVTWGAHELSARWQSRRVVRAFAASLSIVAMIVLTNAQVRTWTNGITLWQHAVAVTRENFIAHTNLGYELAKSGRTDEAVGHYTEALRISPRYVLARQNLALALASEGKFNDAIEQYEAALRDQPANALLRTNLGLALVNAGREGDALLQYTEALRLQPDLALAHSRLGNALVRRGELPAAIAHYEQALRADPTSAEVHNNLGVALASRGSNQAAVAQFAEALRLKPDYADARNNLARARQQSP